MAGGGRNAGGRVDDARPGQGVPRHRVAQRQRDAVAVAQVPHRGETGHQGLAGVLRRLIGAGGLTVGETRQQALLTGPVADQMHVAVDQTRQDETIPQVDHARARHSLSADVPVTHGFDQAVTDDERRGTAWFPARPVEQSPRLHQHDVAGRRLGLARSRHAQRQRQPDDHCFHDVSPHLRASLGTGADVAPPPSRLVRGSDVHDDLAAL